MNDLPSILDLIRDRPDSSEEESEVEEETEVREPNPLEDDIVSCSGLEVSEIVSKISRERDVDFVDISRCLYQTLNNGRVKFVDPSPPNSVFGFFSPIYCTWFWLLCVFVGLLIGSIYLMPQVYPFNYLRIGTGAIFLLFMPGYALFEVLYPGARDFERLERFGMSVGLSLAVVPMVGLVLNYTPWGIRLESALVSLSLLTLALAVVAVYRKYDYWRLAHGA